MKPPPTSRVLCLRALTLAVIAGEALSEFEAELIAEVDERQEAFGAASIVTDREAAVLAEAVAAMEAHLRRLFAAGQLRHERARAGEVAHG